MERQTATGKGQERGLLLLPETRRFGRRSRPLTTPKALTASGSSGGRRALTVRPATTRRTRRVRIHKGRGRGRPRPTPTQRTRDGKVGDQRRTLDLGNYLSQNVLVKKTTRRSRSHRKGATLSLWQSAKNRPFTAFYCFTPATGTTGNGSYRPFS